MLMRHESDGALHIVARDSGVTGEEPAAPPGNGSHSGYTLAVDEVVVANDLERERRFTTIPRGAARPACAEA